jgi:cytochrome c2
MVCHSIGAGAKNEIGPELNALDGRKSGTVEGFNYSEANKAAAITWREATFKDYIKDPRAKIPGTKMVFAGIKNEQEASNLWAYLKRSPNTTMKHLGIGGIGSVGTSVRRRTYHSKLAPTHLVRPPSAA